MTGAVARPAGSRLRRIASSARSAPDLRGRGAGSGRRRATKDGERCDLCAEPVPPSHRHLLDLRSRAISCACRACGLLFDRTEAGGAHYRLLPLRRLRLAGCRLDEAVWVSLGVPVDLAFFSRDGRTGEVSVGYPGPLGAVRTTLDAARWGAVEACHPALPDLADDVEALLVNRAHDASEHWLVPLDDCYRLVAVVRTHWTGLGGGDEVWRRVDGFFAELATGPPRAVDQADPAAPSRAAPDAPGSEPRADPHRPPSSTPSRR